MHLIRYITGRHFNGIVILRLAYSGREVIIYSLYVRILRPLAFGPGGFFIVFLHEKT
nr:MAG TPA: hypothetical protein [Caudoviricetes sp.]